MTHRPPANAAQLLDRANRLMSTPAYRNRLHPDSAEVRSTVTRIYQACYGTEPVAGAGVTPEGTLGPSFRDVKMEDIAR